MQLVYTFALTHYMRIRDLKNPEVAAAKIEATKKRLREKRCMAPDPGKCNGSPIISAHTLSESAMLRPICRHGEVYTPVTDFYSETLENVTRIALRGVGATSTFNGFCKTHDKELFSEIEDRPFVCSRKQSFLHAFRAVAKESYLKRRQAETSPTVEHVRAIHGLNEDQWIEDPYWILHEFGSLLGADELDRYKDRLDALYLAEDWGRLITQVVEFGERPTLVCSAPYSPDFDFHGNALQDFGNFDIDLETLTVTILPSGQGGFALFSYLDTAIGVCEPMVESILEQANLTTALIWFVVGQFENIAFSPDWYESLGDEMTTLLKEHFARSIDPENSYANRLDLCPSFIADWKVQRTFTV